MLFMIRKFPLFCSMEIYIFKDFQIDYKTENYTFKIQTFLGRPWEP